MRVRFLGWEDPLEEGMAAHSSILAWKIPWTEKPAVTKSQTKQKWQHTCVHSCYKGTKFSSPLCSPDQKIKPQSNHKKKALDKTTKGRLTKHLLGDGWGPNPGMVSGNITFFGNRIIADTIKLEWGQVHLIQYDWCLCCCSVAQVCLTLCDPHGL